jgi:hypothetical protein
MSYSSPTESLVRIIAEYSTNISASLNLLPRVKNVLLSGTVFYDQQNNILTKTVGNYLKLYEVVQTTGRKENNLNFRYNPILSESFPIVPNLNGTSSYTIFTRTNNSDAVFVNRFSSPGQKETLGIGRMDRDSEEYAVYNSINLRNFGVRDALDSGSSLHTTQTFTNIGVNIEISGNITYHKINKNKRYILDSTATIATKYDNQFVSYQIPYHPDQVSWLYTSLLKNLNEWPQWFISGSEQTGSEYFFTRTMTGSQFTESSCLDQNKIFGYNSWTQMRTSQNWKSRLLKRNCYIVIDKDQFSDAIFITQTAP